MSPTCHRAVRSLRSCERLNLIQALRATLADRPALTAFHRGAAKDYRRSARNLHLSAR